MAAADPEDLLVDELDELFLTVDNDTGIDSSLKSIPQVKDKVKCSFCAKICLSNRGLSRHMKNKHPDEQQQQQALQQQQQQQQPKQPVKKKEVTEILHPGKLKTFTIRCIQNLSVDDCYPDTVREQFRTAEIKSVDDIMAFYHSISEILLKFNGNNTDKFYAQFYDIVNNNDVCSVGVALGKQCNLLLGFELANHIVSHLTGRKVDDGTFQVEKTSFVGKQKQIISYLSGYVVSTFYRRLRYSKRHKEANCEEYLSLLLACKLVEGSETDGSHHKLIDVKNRGGLWRVKSDVIAVFQMAESYFLSVIKKEFVHKIDANHLVSLMMNDAMLLAYFSGIRKSCELNVKKENALDLLEDMLTLYIRVRSHSFAKDQQQLHKKTKGETKTRSLRTEIKKASSSLDKGH